MGKYLDSVGLAHLIAKIKTYVQQAVASAGNVPSGGTIGQVLTKASNTDNDVMWASPASIQEVDPTVPSWAKQSSKPSYTASEVGAAPTNHASSSDTYGKGTSSNYGHVKLSDSTSSTTAAASGGTAATPKAVKDALDAAKAYADAYDPSGSYLPITGGTLSGVLEIEDTGVNANLRFRRTAVDTSQSDNGVSQTNWSNFGFYDVDDRYYGYVQAGAYATGATRMELYARNLVNGSNVNNGIQLTVAKDGSRTVAVSDPAAWKDALEIGSTAYGAGQSGIASAKAATSVASATTVNLDTITLTAGTWLVTYSAEFASNATGRRVMTLTTNSTSLASTPVYMMATAAANGLATNLSRSQVIVATASTTRYLNVYQNSGSALNCRSCIQAVRIA